MVTILLAVVVLLTLGLALLIQRHEQSLQREVHERSEAEKEREEMKQALLQSQKLEAVGMLAGGIAHNFNNILYAIQGYVQMARADVDSKTISYQNLGKVLEAVERGQELVQGILCFSRREHYNLEQVSLKEVLESAIKLLHSTLPASVELSVNIDLGIALLEGNRTQLQQVFINIIRNAADSLGEKGKIVVQATVESDAEGLKLLRPGLPCAAYFVVNIADNGSGMSEDTLRHLFEPFFTTKDVGKGTGLGLATARSIVRDHRGEMVVQSVPNKGSTFIVLLPVSAGEKEKK
ncbi:MAG: ATP-binding protein [Pseudomonadota bacterium]